MAVESSTLKRNTVATLTWEGRNIGHGVEEGEAEYVYRGIEAGKHRFDPVGAFTGDTLYLFDDEIIDWESLA